MSSSNGSSSSSSSCRSGSTEQSTYQQPDWPPDPTSGWTEVSQRGSPLKRPSSHLSNAQSLSPFPLFQSRRPPSSPPSPPLSNPSAAEKAWEAWTKTGLVAICHENKIQLVTTSKISIIKALVDARIKFRAPPPEHRALPTSSTPTSPPLSQQSKKAFHGSR